MSVATDFETKSEHVSSAGPLLPALVASAAIPALLTPVRLDGRVLIDGGFVNPLPFDLIKGADFVMAVDVSSGTVELKGELPRPIETLLGSQQIALRSIINAKLKLNVPDCLLRPGSDICDAGLHARGCRFSASAVEAKKDAALALSRLTGGSIT